MLKNKTKIKQDYKTSEGKILDLKSFINHKKTQNTALKKIVEKLNTEYNSNRNK